MCIKQYDGKRLHSISGHELKEPYLDTIFEKGSNGYYTPNALLYQDILLYCVERKENEYSTGKTDDFFLTN